MEYRISVRALVEFSQHGEDIRPGGTLRDREEGKAGHKARQQQLGSEWQSEKSLSVTRVLSESVTLTITGRMDVYLPGEIPVIEEIKLWQKEQPPSFPQQAHLSQAVCYAAMITEAESLPSARVRVVYVSVDGSEQAVFEKLYTREECSACFEQLLNAYAKDLLSRHEHRVLRNESLSALTFPYGTWRPGQREMAAQVYRTVRDGKRLFASLPTGCGKSMAALFPALKALREGFTEQIFYLTARTTQRQGPREALALAEKNGARLWTLILDAKEKQCPYRTVCHPDWCERAKGHFLRDNAARLEIQKHSVWTPELIGEICSRYSLCPFEFSLSLVQIADTVICDYNYVLDPAVHIQRIFDRKSSVTLLIDEAHHLSDRTRDMLSGSADEYALTQLRRVCGKYGGRNHPLYKALSALIAEIKALPDAGSEEAVVPFPPDTLYEAARQVCGMLLDMNISNFPWAESGESVTDLWLSLNAFVRSSSLYKENCVCILRGKKHRAVTCRALNVTPYLRSATENMCGVICFSATLRPLDKMKILLGGAEEDTVFEAPSPFPPENLLVIRVSINTRYPKRESTAPEVAERIRTLVSLRPGKYIAFFPSFAYMRFVSACLDKDTPHQLQKSNMTDAEREAFLAPYKEGNSPVLSLCVMGGVFSEGIDLPGHALDGAVIVGTGLPQVNIFTQALRDYYDKAGENGFLYAYQIPGMQKATQAAGRVIRTETDRGVVLLLDDRYFLPEYVCLCPAHWYMRSGKLSDLLSAFSHEENGTARS